MSTNDQDVQAGYTCLEACQSIRPFLATDNGEICPATEFCVGGTEVGEQCPAGSYADGIGLTVNTECNPCAEGFVCASTGMNKAAMLLTPCPEGSYCGSAVVSDATATTCEIGR